MRRGWKTSKTNWWTHFHRKTWHKLFIYSSLYAHLTNSIHCTSTRTLWKLNRSTTKKIPPLHEVPSRLLCVEHNERSLLLFLLLVRSAMSYACCAADVIPVLFVVDMLYGIELNKFLLFFILKECINVMDCRLMPLMALKHKISLAVKSRLKFKN